VEVTRPGQAMFWLDAQFDKRDIIDQEPVDITLHNTCGTVYKKMGHQAPLALGAR
jgi:hypothetical protein